MDIKRTTLENRSEIIRLSLRYNPEKFKEYPHYGGIIYEHDSLEFFQYHLQRSCERDLRIFFILLADPLSKMYQFFEYFNVEFLILAFSYYTCEDMLKDMADYIVENIEKLNKLKTKHQGLTESELKFLNMLLTHPQLTSFTIIVKKL